MKIVVDQNIRGAEDTFGRHATLLVKDGRDIGAADLVDADALIVRTATEVNRDLLQSSPVRFVGTTSIGTDHMDTGWLDRHGIEWASAPGCNADSAAQYSLAMIWLACQRLGRRLDQLCVGIIGRGNVGSRLHRLLQALGVETVANDPPLAELGATDLVPLERALTQDIVTLHVPLTRNGPHQTFGMIGKKQLAFMADGALLVNAARGDVIDGNALTRELRTGRLFAAIDTWPGEPMIQRELLEAAVVATPHVAGYSNDGKRLGTWMVYQAFCKWAALTPHDMPDRRAAVRS
ncbi:MAG: 4-phosphoerythronate dehydrogenase [Gammaproteobacteria bacterium]|nr:4-phosphoerythronate dehydrogenase [Gammaproteobacteria bacterium]